MDPTIAILAFLAVFCASVVATVGVLSLLRQGQILDEPNERSSHVEPTPRGGGLAVVAVLLIAWPIMMFAVDPDGWLDSLVDSRDWIVIAGVLGLAAISWVDDLRGLGPLSRILAQLVAVTAGLLTLIHLGPVFQGLLPRWLDLMAAGLLWLWFVNLFNFMDGIDGITGVETISIGTGLVLLAFAVGLDWSYGVPALAATGAAAGFLTWNWHPARLFLGDVGSVPLGFILGWLLLATAAEGYWAAALILPLYYLADATWTLGRRLVRREAVWRAHREHFYQHAVAEGLSHAAVTLRILLVNIVLVALAVLGATTIGARLAIVMALAVVAALLVQFGRRRGT